ncbi:hypothetical protein [Rhizomonospora bruguierae]|uniref:hypothetical protein n=1 Tax=Rhizomonospora bruguierae TaxID=1581705 RepID=UPI001BCE9C6E|nr:hypothetical protein [Micromonospora sp. NBRC 107566]
MAVTLTYDPRLARVRLSAGGVTGDTAVVERSTDQIRWTAVRGGAAVAVTSGSVAADDYEFAPGVANWYRVRGNNSQSAQITPVIGEVWLKSIARPFLNRTVTVSDVSDIARPARRGIHDVKGRSLPVAVSDVRGSRQWTMSVVTLTDEQRWNLELLLATGDTLLVQVPAGSRVPAGYVSVGDTSQQIHAFDAVSEVALPLTEVAAPGPDVVGATVTWQTVLARYATWADVLAAHPTWVDLMTLIGDPSEVIVP